MATTTGKPSSGTRYAANPVAMPPSAAPTPSAESRRGLSPSTRGDSVVNVVTSNARDAEPLDCCCNLTQEQNHRIDPFCPIHGEMPPIEEPSPQLQHALSVAVLRLTARNAFLEQQVKDLLFDYSELIQIRQAMRRLRRGVTSEKDLRESLVLMDEASGLIDCILTNISTVGPLGDLNLPPHRLPAQDGHVRCPVNTCRNQEKSVSAARSHYAVHHVPSGQSYNDADFPWAVCDSCDGTGGWHQRSHGADPRYLLCPDCKGRGWNID